MPAKKTTAGQQYRIDGKTFYWTTEDGATVAIPMRIRLKVIRQLGTDTGLDAKGMFRMLEALAPGQAGALDEMDVNEFQSMFTTWQAEYNALSGASLGEAGSSSS